ncbi:MAG: SGNH/GDSL hydrolase family protein [Bacteroidetes bacterium]|nr:SGNH/GDSL hydrolase family protein [Bacteroidota bacterium]
MPQQKHYTLLCLGDSYTIGESVEERERFSEQALDILKSKGIKFEKPKIIARTGWTTDELSLAIQEEKLESHYDFVTLLIGVNNQYRGQDLESYRQEFATLLQTAIRFAGRNKNHVIVLSIPDWGVTPFVSQDAKKRSSEAISREIDAFNKINHEEAEGVGAHYIDITSISRQVPKDPGLVASDGLHPSGRMYSGWAKLLAEKFYSLIRG